MSPVVRKDLPVERFATKETWDLWLRRHHETSPGIWLEMAKKGSGVASVSHVEALEVALCCGWIDGQTASVDSTWYLQRFTRGRREASGRESTARASSDFIARVS